MPEGLLQDQNYNLSTEEKRKWGIISNTEIRDSLAKFATIKIEVAQQTEEKNDGGLTVENILPI